MKKGFIIVLIILALIAIAYFTFGKKLMAKDQLIINITDIDFSNLTNPKINLEIINPSRSDISFEGLAGELFVGDTAFATVTNFNTINILQNERKTVSISVKGIPLGVPVLLDSIMKKSNPTYKFVGTVRAEGFSLPYTKIFNPKLS